MSAGRPSRRRSLAPGSSLPAGLTLNPDGTITGTPTAAVSGQQVGVHAADVSGQTADTQFAITVAAAPRAADLRVILGQSGTFRRGSTDSVLVRVANNGTAGTQGPMTAWLMLPAGVTPTSASGTDWTCTRNGQVVACTRTKTLWARQTSTVTVRVHVTAPAGQSLAVLAAVAPDDATPADNTTTRYVHIA